MTRAERVKPSVRRRTSLSLERLEERQMLNATPVAAPPLAVKSLHPAHLDHTQGHVTATAVRHAQTASAHAAALNLVHVRANVSHGLAVANRLAKSQASKLPLLKPNLDSSMIISVSPPDTDPMAGPGASAFGPSQIRKAYGIDLLANQGEGMTVAIVDAFDNPTIAADLATFSTYYGLPQMDGLGGNATFTKVTPPGQAAPAPNGGWAGEIALDVEWVHAAAPKANIILVEATDNSYANLITNVTSALNYAKARPGVVVVSNSYGGGEFGGETAFDTNFGQAAGHTNVAFTFSTGDNGSPGSYPAYSPNVIAVGGTSLTISSARGKYGKERGWGGSGGGTSLFETKPAYQNAPFFVSLSNRSQPDISMVADPNTGVAVFSTYAFGGWAQIGGTSLSAPLFAGVVALVDQARAAKGFAPLDSATLLTRLYNDFNSASYANDFHDVIGGSNGAFGAVAGYDRVTGIGTPKVDQVVALLSANA